MAREKPRYDGILGERFTYEELKSEGFFELRFFALMEHYGIEYDDKKLNSRLSWMSWRELALALAHDHVPGCQMVIESGRKSERAITDLIITFSLSLAEYKGKSINAAAGHLARKLPHLELSPQSIRRRFYNLKKQGRDINVRDDRDALSMERIVANITITAARDKLR
ncbi:MAG: hypothetical protein CMM60_03135 [Rhodospirillaceae bacterium]|jgi:hypothetical protein|nr:hypothetical protein [Rhodospirillaceae bacterium]|tara:strand:- start:533 stop:1036 length:504 start_codon:yes stop_codon:yes gene_type:complete